MATIKSYTDISQSMKLAEILPLESADMYYPNRTDVKYQGALPIEFKLGNPLLSQEIACWSLAALFDVVPGNYIDVDDTIKHPSLMKTKDSRYMVIYSAFQYTSLYNNPIDACVEMIIRLNEFNFL